MVFVRWIILQELYNEGARTILVKNVAPQGCQPFWLSLAPANDLDKYGCSISFNKAVRYYNFILRWKLSNLQNELKDANIIYVNNYDIVSDLMTNPSNYGTAHCKFDQETIWLRIIYCRLFCFIPFHF